VEKFSSSWKDCGVLLLQIELVDGFEGIRKVFEVGNHLVINSPLAMDDIPQPMILVFLVVNSSRQNTKKNLKKKKNCGKLR
jgi:hypothetical protein